MKIAFVPIDNRPVCYSLAEQIVKINNDLKIFLPPKEFLGDLTQSAKIDNIVNWLKNLEQVDKIILSLDTIAYGGLVPSRRSTDSFEIIKERILNLKSVLETKNAKIYAFSSIMRISNNNINEEEKEYWNKYGKEIFKYSYDYHKNGKAETNVPQEIIDDYLKTRKRNFEINKIYIKWAQENFFQTLVFSKDDCAEFGLNVAEAKVLGVHIAAKKCDAQIKTGADEIPLSLLARAIVDKNKIKICPIFTNPNSVNKISKYEDVSVYDSVKGQIELAGGTVVDEQDCDICLLVNNFKEEQGELVMDVNVDGFNDVLKIPQKPYLIADILNANGADNKFVEQFLSLDINWSNFLGYAGWNTTGNTIGSALCCAIIKYLALNPNMNNFKKVQSIRFLDDWAYQANVRQNLKSYLTEPNINELKKQLIPFEEKIKEKFGINFDTKYSYPWNRFFEIEVVLN